MKNKWSLPRTLTWIFGTWVLSTGLFAQSNGYRTPEEINRWLNSFVDSHPKTVKLHKIATSPGGTGVIIAEIGKEISVDPKTLPAVLVVANMDGLRPLGSEGAIHLAESLVKNEDLLAKRSWYILAQGNPDAAARYFDRIKLINPGNATPANNDMDENTDEDDFNDLNGDGYITIMRQKHPEGNMIVVADEPRLMRKADTKDGETGIYRIFLEGIDDDGDGKYNEDIAGGTNVNLNFPHLFDHFDTGTGLYPGSAPEARGIMEFVFGHPEIAMAVAFGETNFCLSPPRGGRSGEVDLQKIKIPERFASMLGADKDKTYSMEEIIEMVKPMVPAGVEVSESMIASFLGLGAVVNPLPKDLEFYNKFSKDYKKYLEDKGVKAERFDPERARDGSFELWAYYHLGIPVFSMDLFSMNKPEKKKQEGSGITLESLEKMSTEEFVALGEEKINQFLKESGAPEQFNAERVIQMMESGQGDPARMAAMMKQMPKPEKDEKSADPKEQALLGFSDEVLQGKGFVNWQKYNHPTLGEVEIGGFIPYLGTTPPYEMVDSLLELQVPWILELAENLPELSIYQTKVTDKGAGVYLLEVWVENKNYIPFPIAMGQRNSTPSPAILLVEGNNIEFLQGYGRTPLKEVPGLSKVKQSWLIVAGKKAEIKVQLTSKAAGNDVKTVKIGG